MKASKFLLWGHDAESIMETGYKYRLLQAIVAAADIVIVGTAISIMASSSTTFGKYFQVMLIVLVCTYFLTTLLTHRPMYKAYMFLSGIRDFDVHCDIICVTPDELYDMMYREQRIRLKRGDSVAHYVSVINNTCKINSMYPYRMYSRLVSHASEAKEGSVQLYVYSVKRNKRKPAAVVHVSLEDEFLRLGQELWTNAKASSVAAENHIKGIIPEPKAEEVKYCNEELERRELEKQAAQQESVEFDDSMALTDGEFIEVEAEDVICVEATSVDSEVVSTEEDKEELPV